MALYALTRYGGELFFHLHTFSIISLHNHSLGTGSFIRKVPSFVLLAFPFYILKLPNAVSQAVRRFITS